MALEWLARAPAIIKTVGAVLNNPLEQRGVITQALAQAFLGAPSTTTAPTVAPISTALQPRTTYSGGLSMFGDEDAGWGLSDVFSGIQQGVQLISSLQSLDEPRVIRDYGPMYPVADDNASAGAGSLPRIAAAAGATIWGVLRRGAGGILGWITSPSGVRFRMSDLWPAVRKYGPGAVATALGFTAAELANLLMQAPTTGRKRRGRGITAANIRTTRRTIKTLRGLSRLAGIRQGGYRPRYQHRHRHWH